MGIWPDLLKKTLRWKAAHRARVCPAQQMQSILLTMALGRKKTFAQMMILLLKQQFSSKNNSFAVGVGAVRFCAWRGQHLWLHILNYRISANILTYCRNIFCTDGCFALYGQVATTKKRGWLDLDYRYDRNDRKLALEHVRLIWPNVERCQTITM